MERDELLELRLAADLTQVDAAALIGVSYSTVQNWEAGRYLASPRLNEYVRALKAVMEDTDG